MENNFLCAYIFVIALGFGLPDAAFGAQLFGVGEEYKYKYEALVIAGSQEPSSFASAYKIEGILKIASVSSTTLSVSIDDLAIGLYNGPWSYFPIPDFKFITPAELAPLGERFLINVEDGLFKKLILNDQEPEWASNLKRGLATYLQMDLKSVTSFNDVQILKVSEMTTMGECPTKYEVLPGSTTLNRLTRVSKFRNHADCPDMPKRARISTDAFYSCADQTTQDIVNSTSYSTYEMELNDGQPLLKGFNVYSSLLFWPFTSESSYRYSWLNMTLSLISHASFGSREFPGPENEENHEDLSYVFEQSDPSDTEDENIDLKSETIFFHHISVESDPEFTEKTQKLFQEKISEFAETLQNSKERIVDERYFQGNAQLEFLNLAASLDYDHLTQCYTKYLAAAGTSRVNLTEFHVFLDSLILVGTTPAALVLRDILLSTKDSTVQTRIAPLFSYHIRNPSEALAKEMDPLYELFGKNTVSPPVRSLLEYSMASLIGRCCKKTLCVSSGILKKYIDYFESKLTVANNFEDRTSAILALGNIGQGQALNKILDIAAGKLVHEQPVRVQSIWALKSLAYREKEKVFGALLPVFFNRSESCEIRTTIFTFLMSVNPAKKTLHEIAYFMWTETCPQTMNVVRTFLTNAVKSQSPCNKLGKHARTILTYMPPGIIDPTRTSTYVIDYYDKEFGFGHQIQATVQKTWRTSLPVSIYLGLNNYIAGFGSSYFGLFIRMEGIEKAIATKLSELRSVNLEEVQKILSKIGVTRRPAEPLRLEIVLFFQGNAITYFAADEKTISKIPTFLKAANLKDSLVFNWERTLSLGGIFYQQPLEIGAPLSVFAGITATANFTRSKSELMETSDPSTRTQIHLFGHFQIANHAPLVGTMHTVSSYRSFRMLIPRQLSIGFEKEGGFRASAKLPSSKNPFLILAHSTSVTAVAYDSTSRVRDDVALQLLQQSCPTCQASAVVSNGINFRSSRIIPTPLPSFIKGVKLEAKFFDCERDHSRSAVIKKIRHFLSGSNKNTGFFDFPISKFLLSLQHARHYAFLAPFPETCGFLIQATQDESAQTKLTTIEGVLQLDIPEETKNVNLGSKFKFIYSGVGEQGITGLRASFNLSRNFQEGKLRLESNGHTPNLNRVACMDVTVKRDELLKDKLSFTGEDEPSIAEKIRITYGKTGAIPCPTDHVEINISGLARRSPEQIAEADSGLPPYGQCLSQKGSKDYPGPFVPPTSPCLTAAIEQTVLRSGNATLTYKISEEIKTKWRRPVAFIAGMLQGFAVDNSEESRHKSHATSLPKTPGFYKGEVETDINIKKDLSSTLDLHYRSSSQESEEHFHGIDLSFLPEVWKPRPVSSRFSPLWLLGLKLGALGYCSVFPGVVQTLDGVSYPVDLPNCETVISADCGPKPQYAILARRVSSEKLVVTIRLGSDEIKLDGSNNVFVNGAKTTLPDKETVTGSFKFILIKNGEEVTLRTFELGMDIRYTGSFVRVLLTSRYRGIHCGLCGHWDSNIYNDMIGPDVTCPGLLTPDKMVKAYTVREGSCSGFPTSRC